MWQWQEVKATNWRNMNEEAKMYQPGIGSLGSESTKPWNQELFGGQADRDPRHMMPPQHHRSDPQDPVMTTKWNGQGLVCRGRPPNHWGEPSLLLPWSVSQGHTHFTLGEGISLLHLKKLSLVHFSLCPLKKILSVISFWEKRPRTWDFHGGGTNFPFPKKRNTRSSNSGSLKICGSEASPHSVEVTWGRTLGCHVLGRNLNPQLRAA